MHAILTPVGSAGDVNPFIVIGAELRRRGHRVTIITADVFARVAAKAGLEFVAVGTAEEYDQTTRNPDLWNARRGLSIVFGVIAKQLQRAYAAIEQLYEPDQTLLVGHSLSFPTRVFEETHSAPAVTIHLSPGIFRSDFAQSALPSGYDPSAWPRWTKRALWWAVDRFAVDPLIVPALNRWRAELGLPPVSRLLKSWMHSPQCVLGLFPEWFGDPQPDWPRQLHLPGFVLSDESCAPDAGTAGPRNAALDEFLAHGDPPIVFTPGTANRFAEPFFRAGIEATGTIGRRALLVTSYRDHLPRQLPPHVQHIDYAAFGSLFPRAAAVVHHGGIGTCAQALAAGVPQLVMPIGFDQPDNAARVRRLGAGDWIPPGRFRARAVASVLTRLLADAQVGAACREWQRRIDGLASKKRVCDLLEAHYAARTSRRVSQAGAPA
jgi:UDP:flavonoid glycosyltransferase YjiC (YdhE family)